MRKCIDFGNRHTGVWILVLLLIIKPSERVIDFNEFIMV